MSARTRALRQARTLVAREGEPVILPSGALVLGILSRQGEPAEPDFSTAGLDTQLGDIPNPSVWLLDSDAEGIAMNDPLKIAGVDYRATMPPRADGEGLSRIELAHAESQMNPGAQWQ